MARGPKKHLKRIRAPKSWMMDKMGGVFATRPCQGPHKLRDSMPLHIILQRKLGYALGYKEAYKILKDKDNEVKIDGKVRRNFKFPVGLMGSLFSYHRRYQHPKDWRSLQTFLRREEKVYFVEDQGEGS